MKVTWESASLVMKQPWNPWLQRFACAGPLADSSAVAYCDNLLSDDKGSDKERYSDL